MLLKHPNEWTKLVYSVETAQEALEIIRSGQAVAFIGSGLSLGFYPSWEEIIKKLCKNCGVEFRKGSSSEEFIKKAEECKQKNKRIYYSTLTQLLGKEPSGFRRTYILMLSLPFKGYITINLDPMLASVARDLKGIHEPFVYPLLPYEKLNNGRIFYIHGFLGSYGRESKKIVFSESEFKEAYDSTNSFLPSFLSQVFGFGHVIFIGCRLREPQLYELLKIIRNIKETQLNYPREILKHYILLPKRKEEEEEEEKEENSYYEQIGIRVIRYNPLDRYHTGLDKILERWCDLEPIRPVIDFASLEEFDG